MQPRLPLSDDVRRAADRQTRTDGTLRHGPRVPVADEGMGKIRPKHLLPLLAARHPDDNRFQRLSGTTRQPTEHGQFLPADTTGAIQPGEETGVCPGGTKPVPRRVVQSGQNPEAGRDTGAAEHAGEHGFRRRAAERSTRHVPVQFLRPGNVVRGYGLPRKRENMGRGPALSAA